MYEAVTSVAIAHDLHNPASKTLQKESERVSIVAFNRGGGTGMLGASSGWLTPLTLTVEACCVPADASKRLLRRLQYSHSQCDVVVIWTTCV